MQDTPHTEPRDRRFSTLLAIESVLAVALLAWWALGTPRGAPSLTWQIESAPPLEAYGKVGVETPFRLALELPQAAHVYVVSFDALRGNVALFPSEFLRTDLPANPLPAGTWSMPGAHLEQPLQWHTGDAGGPLSVMVIASDEPLAELESALATFRQMGNAAFPTRTLLGTYAPSSGIETAPSRHTVHTGVLQAAFELDDATANGAMAPLPGHPGVFAKVLRLDVDAPDLADVEAQIRATIEPLQGALGAPPSPPAEPR